jgi:hypothetical protein
VGEGQGAEVSREAGQESQTQNERGGQGKTFGNGKKALGKSQGRRQIEAVGGKLALDSLPPAMVGVFFWLRSKRGCGGVEMVFFAGRSGFPWKNTHVFKNRGQKSTLGGRWFQREC